MLEKLQIRSSQIAESTKDVGLWATVKSCVYENSEAIPVFKDLTGSKEFASVSSGLFTLLEITPDNTEIQTFSYPLKSRKLKTRHRLKCGFSSYVLIDQGYVLADVWFVVGPSQSINCKHKDLSLLQIDLGPNDVYMFDLYLAKDRRGQATATNFMTLVLNTLKRRGYKKAYGYFLKDNTPALWVHRILGYEELATVRIKRYGLFEKAMHLHG